jgi:hypothetical protein
MGCVGEVQLQTITKDFEQGTPNDETLGFKEHRISTKRPEVALAQFVGKVAIANLITVRNAIPDIVKIADDRGNRDVGIRELCVG